MLLSIDKSMSKTYCPALYSNLTTINLTIKCAVATVKDKNDQSKIFSARPSHDNNQN